MGLDVGTTGISAALLNVNTRQLYPLSGSVGSQPETTEALYRLPALAYWSPMRGELSLVSPEAVLTDDSELSASEQRGVFLQNLKPYLKVGIPYESAQTGDWEPVLQGPEEQPVALYWIRQALQALLRGLNPNAPERVGAEEGGEASSPLFSVSTAELEPQSLRAALAQLGGAIVSCPADWSEAYRFNVREAVLGAGLVASPEQVCFVEEAIASLLAQLHPADVTLKGYTPIIHAGATTTELALVELPEQLEDLTYDDFIFRSFPYGGNALDQDIICQMLCPPGERTIRPPQVASTSALQFLPAWHWQPANVGRLAGITWESLGLERLELPQPGEPDLLRRYQLQQCLERSPLGQALLDAARHVKLILQHQESFTLDLGEYRWLLRRQDLESRVLAPWMQCLNRELNRLMVQQGISVEAIAQVICTGGTANLPAIADWLQQKLPNATLIREGALQVSRDTPDSALAVALGLAVVPLYPQLLDTPRQQYNDYFLLLELLRIFGEEALSVGRIMQRLERRGINTRTCQQRILAFLEGKLPPGLFPMMPDSSWLTEASQQNFDYQAITATALFEKEERQTYRLNLEQCDRWFAYLNRLLEPTHQTLEEPYVLYGTLQPKN